jgi:hypothetical protein
MVPALIIAFVLAVGIGIGVAILETRLGAREFDSSTIAEMQEFDEAA